MTGLTERGEIEVGRSFKDALARLKRRREALRGQLAEIESELRDLGAIEAALALTIEALAKRKPGEG
jgi:prefoldin subunit 5